MKKYSIFLLTISIIFCFTSCIKDDGAKKQKKYISAYLEDAEEQGQSFTEKASGIYYYEHKSGVGANTPQPGDTIYIQTNVYDLSTRQESIYSYFFSETTIYGYIMGKNIGESPALDGMGALMRGVDEGVRLMKKGGESLIVAPSHLSYGDYNYYYNPFTPLLFYVKLIDIKRPIIDE